MKAKIFTSMGAFTGTPIQERENMAQVWNKKLQMIEPNTTHILWSGERREAKQSDLQDLLLEVIIIVGLVFL